MMRQFYINIILLFCQFVRMKTIFVLFLSFLLLTDITLSSNCPSSQPSDLLQSGKLKQTYNVLLGEDIYFQVEVKIQIPSWGFDFATALSSIENFESSKGISHIIMGRRRGQTNILQISGTINPATSWTSIQISYLISTRDDMLVQNSPYYKSKSLVKKEPRIFYDIVIDIKKDLPVSNYKVAAFITGFSTSNTQPRIAVNDRYFDQKLKTLTLTIICTFCSKPSTFAFSYIIYPQTHPNFDFQLGESGYPASYQLKGPTSFPFLNSIQFSSFKILNKSLKCSGGDCDSTCVSAKKCQQSDGNIFQDSSCIICPPGILYDSGKCTRQCIPNQFYNNRFCVCQNEQAETGRNCVLKPTKLILPQKLCSYTQIKNGNQCIKCPPESLPSQKRTICICPEGQTYKVQTNTCLSDCKDDEVYDPNSEKCVKAQKNLQ